MNNNNNNHHQQQHHQQSQRRHSKPDNNSSSSSSTSFRDEHKSKDVMYSNPGLIYSAPTVDTLGDESMSMRAYATPRVVASHHQKHTITTESTSTTPATKSTTTTATTNTNTNHTGKSNPSMADILAKTALKSAAEASGRKPRSRLHQVQKKLQSTWTTTTTTTTTSTKHEKDFQHPQDAMHVSIRTIAVGERSAFEAVAPPSLEALQRQQQRGRTNHHHNNNKTSPSLQHLQILHTLQQHHQHQHQHQQNKQTQRQLVFSPSVGASSDLLYPGDHAIRRRRKRRSGAVHSSDNYSDGRYRSIDPVQATLNDLPKTPPLLSNKKTRLPLRADVGFPNATSQEIQQKQKEISLETEWEEASPRLIVLVTSDDLGTATVEEDGQGGIPPYAGYELAEAKRRNQTFFNHRNTTNKKNGVETTTATTPSATTTTTSTALGAPNRYSVLAPPLDATYSSTQGWRPRPVHDRPSGRHYSLVSPIRLDFAVGKIEPLIASLSLYQLNNTTSNSSGKCSEDFYFPAGDWRGKLSLQNADPHFRAATQEWFLKRKHKALFSHTTSTSNSTTGEQQPQQQQDLYVVLKVFQVTHLDLATAYVSQSNEAQAQQTSVRAATVWEAYGSQFLTPLCFGVLPLSNASTTTMKWPQGQVQSMTLYVMPTKPDSSQDFVRRLSTICKIDGGGGGSFATNPSLSSSSSLSPSSSPTNIATTTTATSAAAEDSAPTTTKRKGLGRRLLSAKKALTVKRDTSGGSATTETTTAAEDADATPLEATPIIPAKVELFVSQLPLDFPEALLHTPQELQDGSKSSMPNLLVDVSGTLAIRNNNNNMDPNGSDSSSSSKRSHLVRLPLKANGYRDVSDFREVLYLPPLSTAKDYDVMEVSHSYPSVLNLLYLYPRLLRLDTATATKPRLARKSSKSTSPATTTTTRYTVRIRLIQSVSEATEEGIIEANTTTLRQFHNPAPWAGPSQVTSVYTKLPGQGVSMHDSSGVALQDEFKLGLPDILDGTHFLQFTLYSVDVASDELDESVPLDSASPGIPVVATPEDLCGLHVQSIAEMTIPLSSNKTRDPVSGAKVTTIIPNGCHRIKLGDFQLQVETRLLSSLHLADPALATALRDFPNLAQESSRARLERLSLSSSTIPAAPSSYAALFAAASPAALVSHFPPIFWMHLRNLVQNPAGGTVVGEAFLMDCMISLLQVYRQIRDFLTTSTQSDQQRLDYFVKTVVDAYDEVAFVSRQANNNKGDTSPDEDSASEVAPSELAERSSSAEGEFDDEDFDGGAIRRRKKDSFRNEIDLKISRTFSAMETSDVGFHRTAYGATKTDRMRLEAEIDVDSSRYSHLVDDDETVVTFATAFSGDVRMSEAREAFERAKRPTAIPKEQPNDTILLTPDAKISQDHRQPPNTDFSYRSIAELGLAKRVTSAAKVMLAPCVPPSFFNPSSSPKGWQSEGSELPAIENMTISGNGSNLTSRSIARKGSDVFEDDVPFQSQGSDLDSDMLEMTESFRSPHNCPALRFSVRFEASGLEGALPVNRGEYLYESVLLLWLKAGTGQIVKKSGNGFRKQVILDIPPLNKETENQPIYKLYSGLELLLPLCLKSIALRYGEETKHLSSPSARVIVDREHLAVFQSFFEMVPTLLMRDALSGLTTNKAQSLRKALAKLEVVLDFLIGLYSILHPAHVAVLTKLFFSTLRNAEAEGVEILESGVKFEWNEENLFRVKCSRQLRLRAVEKLAVLPNFIAFNYPLDFANEAEPSKPNKPSWTSQQNATETKESQQPSDPIIEDELSPPAGWLADILTRESLSICALSCEAVVAEAMAHIETQDPKTRSKSLKQRPTASLTREDLLMFQSIAMHGITCVHELLLRRHAMDDRYQKETARGRIAALFAIPILEKSLASVRWLARMESTHRVRSLWLLCFTYILQEAPETLLRRIVSSYIQSNDIQIHRFIRLLRLGSATFQSFIDQPRYCMFPSEIDVGISPWLLQESFNTICATTIVVVEEGARPAAVSQKEKKKLTLGVLDLLLHILTTPQSSVTHLRAAGGAIQALEGFGIAMFLEVTGKAFQHWIRIMLSLMNSIALSVRSIAVDFIVSLLGSAFDLYGNIDEIALVFATVLPEVAAREIALCSVSGHVTTIEDAERAVWPLRRSFADLEDANPLDDDRVDPQLSPVLSIFCRASQAILDGVLIEMRLRGDGCVVVGVPMKSQPLETYAFDADEESLFEASNFFLPEVAPLQRIRWLMTLKSLHKAKGQWIEAAESLMMCARAISESMPHLVNIWRPSRFPLWSDSRRSLWLATVGEEIGIPDRGNDQVMDFADNYLEPDLFGKTSSSEGKLPQPTIAEMCDLLSSIAREAVEMYLREEGMDDLAYTRLESLLIVLTEVLSDHSASEISRSRGKIGGILGRRQRVQEEAALRKVIAGISGDMTKLAERMLQLEERNVTKGDSRTSKAHRHKEKYFIRLLLSGKKPTRFLESTTLPTFLEWSTPCICRVPKALADRALLKAGKDRDRLEEAVCSAFGKPIRNALLKGGVSAPIVCRLGNKSPSAADKADTVYVDLGFVQWNPSDVMESEESSRDSSDLMPASVRSKHFIYRKPPDSNTVISNTFVEVTVANVFPCPLSRQRSLLTSEFVPSS